MKNYTSDEIICVTKNLHREEDPHLTKIICGNCELENQTLFERSVVRVLNVHWITLIREKSKLIN